jgi:hypothetical protein
MIFSDFLSIHLNLVGRESIRFQPFYRDNPKKTKEIQRWVKELMTKRYIRESMSPYAVLVLLIQKKGWDFEDVCWLSY